MASFPSPSPPPMGSTSPTGKLRVVVGLGANLGDRAATFREAVVCMGQWARVVARSLVYETEAVGPPQPDYLNAAVLLEWPHTPADLLGKLQALEQQMGRVRDVRWGPRTLDLDILWVEGLWVESPALRVPHPALRERPFALQPLLDVAPEAVDPRDGQSLSLVLLDLRRGEPLAAVPFDWDEASKRPRDDTAPRVPERGSGSR